ncbi:MAG: hypothetical protein ABMB14_25610, partial [Myxococcota bacterium]
GASGEAGTGGSSLDLAGHATARLGGRLATDRGSVELTDQPGRNRLDVDLDGDALVVKFLGLLAGALRVELPGGGSASAKGATASEGKVTVSDGGREVRGTVGSVELDDVTGAAR